jgi:hypothetical protein
VQGVCEPLRGKVLRVAVLPEALIQASRRIARRSQAGGRKLITRRGSGEGQIPLDRRNAQITKIEHNLQTGPGPGRARRLPHAGRRGMPVLQQT